MTQVRAVRTREALVLAAAAEVDQHGYTGAGLARITERAGASMGALTFHFRSKAELARAVLDTGSDRARRLAAGLSGAPGPALEVMGQLVRGLAELLEKDQVVRAAARLARERPDSVGQWSSAWGPAVRTLLAQAAASGELRPRVDPEGAAALVEYLLAGVDAWPARAGGPEAGRRLDRVWPLVERGLLADDR
ncbi:helix-turn-helix domain-containing protein [Streptomyces sp. NPDC006552]|uniref:helix-turn-helix domain-containing protein n=1 Tax=Streptomyces sp. NPDC006552 TaxID=3157179 RepID=UPI0033BD1D59